MNCQWCGRPLSDDFGYSETGEIICASYSTHNRAYSACKARSHRLRQKIAKQQDKGTVANPDVLQGQSALIEALQIIITQNDELIALQRQQLNAPKPQIVTNTKVISTTTFAEPNFDDVDFDVEIKQDKSTKSAETFRQQMMDMADKKGVWADKPKDVKQ